MRAKPLLAACVLGIALSPGPADAFCGFYVGGAGTEMFNNATQVVMMRDGTRTVLSMQNNYDGPPKNFAMVVPVPVVLEKDNVKTLNPEVFAKTDRLGAPRLVQYWEQDPCRMLEEEEDEGGTGTAMAFDEGKMGKADSDREKVTVLRQFVVGEYEIVILKATEAAALESWLKTNKYNIPDGAEEYLKPYVQGGSKFFVAKVDTSKVTFNDKGQAMLSPLRFYYDTEEFKLPVRLGLMNAKGKQDLIVNILARRQRYEVANYPNVTIPTNLDVRPVAKDRFGEFYAALFDRTLEKNPGAVVTEYSWSSAGCDPCPGPALNWSDLNALGQDVIDAANGGGRMGRGGAWVLTRLHARYDKTTMRDDLVFKEANPISGGREVLKRDGKLEEGAVPAGQNNFQARYAIRHKWTGPVNCANPMFGVWGGPDGASEAPPPAAARDLAFVKRGQMRLPRVVKQDIPEIGVLAVAGPVKPYTEERPKMHRRAKMRGTGCGCSTDLDRRSAGGTGLLVLGAAVLLVRRRRRRR